MTQDLPIAPPRATTDIYHAIRHSHPDRNIAYCGAVRPPGKGFPEREVPVENRCKECVAVMMLMGWSPE